MSTTLYRHFDGDGALLYVGISLSWPERTKAHARGSRWFDQVARVEIERFPTREAALVAERDAIKAERPKFNVVHNRAEPANASKRGQAWSSGHYDGWVDPIFTVVKGPDAIVGPALIYRDDQISIMIAHGEFGTAGVLTEVVLGKWAGELPSFADACDVVISVRRGGELTISEARKSRDAVIQKLRQRLRTVEEFATDISLAVANASRFPSAKSRQILDEIAMEREIAE